MWEHESSFNNADTILSDFELELTGHHFRKRAALPHSDIYIAPLQCKGSKVVVLTLNSSCNATHLYLFFLNHMTDLETNKKLQSKFSATTYFHLSVTQIPLDACLLRSGPSMVLLPHAVRHPPSAVF